MMFGHKRHAGIAANNDEACRQWSFSHALITELTVTTLGNTSLGSRSWLFVHFPGKGRCSWVCQPQKRILNEVSTSYLSRISSFKNTTSIVSRCQQKHVPKENCLQKKLTNFGWEQRQHKSPAYSAISDHELKILNSIFPTNYPP